MQKVASGIGISPAAISRWHKGVMPSKANAKALIEYFGVSASELFGDDGGAFFPPEQSSEPVQSGNLVDAYAGLRKDYDDFRAIVQSQQNTIQTLSESTKNMTESNKNWSESGKTMAETGKTWAETSKNLSESTKNLSESTKNLSKSNQNLSESIKSLAAKGR